MCTCLSWLATGCAEDRGDPHLSCRFPASPCVSWAHCSWRHFVSWYLPNHLLPSFWYLFCQDGAQPWPERWDRPTQARPIRQSPVRCNKPQWHVPWGLADWQCHRVQQQRSKLALRAAWVSPDHHLCSSSLSPYPYIHYTITEHFSFKCSLSDFIK